MRRRSLMLYPILDSRRTPLGVSSGRRRMRGLAWFSNSNGGNQARPFTSRSSFPRLRKSRVRSPSRASPSLTHGFSVIGSRLQSGELDWRRKLLLRRSGLRLVHLGHARSGPEPRRGTIAVSGWSKNCVSSSATRTRAAIACEVSISRRSSSSSQTSRLPYRLHVELLADLERLNAPFFQKFEQAFRVCYLFVSGRGLRGRKFIRA